MEKKPFQQTSSVEALLQGEAGEVDLPFLPQFLELGEELFHTHEEGAYCSQSTETDCQTVGVDVCLLLYIEGRCEKVSAEIFQP